MTFTSDDPSPTEPARHLSRAEEDEHLVREHRLVKVNAYICDPDRLKARNLNAQRQQRLRDKRKEAGLVSAPIPSSVAEAMREAGGFEQWLTAHMVKHPRVERVEVPTLSAEQRRLIGVGRRVEALSGFRRWVVRKMLG